LSSADSLALFVTVLRVSAPTFAWVLLGVALHRAGLLTDRAIAAVSRLAFNCGLPVMLFAGAAQVDYAHLGGASYLLAGVLATLSMAAASWFYSRWRGHPRAQRGIFVQAAFRSNLAIVGVALTFSAYGERGPALAALPVAVLTALYNVLAVWVLDTTLGSSASPRAILAGILRNPLLLGIGAGVALSLSGLPQPAVIAPLGRVLSTFFLPVILLCIGASMRLSQLRGAGPITREAACWRLVVGPLVAVLLAFALGVRGEHLGVLYLLLSSPVAASSHVMVVAARGDGVLAANIVVLTTLLSALSVTLGFYLLALLGLVGELA
jgi:predicted permease